MIKKVQIYINDRAFCYDKCCFESKPSIYYDDELNIYFLSDGKNKKYVNKDGELHRIDGYASKHNINFFYLSGVVFFAFNFAKKTKHLICDICGKCCKQNCFYD